MAERWEIISLQFEVDQAKTSYINGELAKCEGYEPFDSFWRVIGGVETFTILLKRKVEKDPVTGAAHRALLDRVAAAPCVYDGSDDLGDCPLCWPDHPEKWCGPCLGREAIKRGGDAE